MLIAKNRQDDILHAGQANREEFYFCPGCGEKVFLKRGPYVTAHFSHYRKDQCVSFSEGETLEHLKGKKILYYWFKSSGLSVELEPYLKELKQRPDLLIRKGERRFAVEFQCSPMKESDFIKRTQGYISQDIEVIWILGSPFFNTKKGMTKQRKKFMRHDQATVYLLSLDVSQTALNIWHDFSSLHPQLNYKKTSYILKDITAQALAPLTLTKKSSHSFTFQNIKHDHSNLTKKRHYSQIGFFQELYKRHENLISLPLEVYVRLKDDWMLGEYYPSILWKLILLKYIERRGAGSILSFHDVECIVQSMISKNEIQWLNTPLLNERIKFRPILQFIRVLEKTGCLQSIGHDEWLIYKKAKRFQREEEKIETLRRNY